jgi:undecaprenyl-diphosphatase
MLKLTLIAGMLYFLLQRYLRWRKPDLNSAAEKYRMSILLVLATILIGLKVSEAALSGRSAPMDEAILLFLHHYVPAALIPFFGAITLTGSFNVLLTLTVLSCLVFLGLKRRFEVLLLASSAICGAALIYLLKRLTERQRPALWETKYYWGTSFPSGHTLETTCFAMALTLCLRPFWPDRIRTIRIIALVWVFLVGWSRLVLGVHWPTDVLAAACLGMLIPIALQFMLVRLGFQRAGAKR